MDFSRRRFLSRSAAAGAVAPTLATAPALAAGPAAAAPTPWGATPLPRQWKWHQRGMYAFVHFSMNTFTGKEWGYGDEKPEWFNPTDFSADQIVLAAKSAGMTGVILTAKHHDGFCLWQTQLTEHSIRNSPYKGGKGDIVAEMGEACRRHGLSYGLYLSPWDRNHAEYGRPAYVEYYRAQLTELCTRYGPLFEVWFDGANGGDGYYGGARETRHIDAPRYYNWPSIIALVHQMQPDACTFDPLGADIRWVGNEDGVAGDPCWPTMPNKPYEQDVGNAGLRGGEIWWPAETDVSIRPGWFYHPDEDTKVKSPDRLVRLYDESVGRGTNLNLNLPPDQRGRLADHDVAVLQSFGDAMRATLARDLAKGAVAHASAVRGGRFAPAAVLDGRSETYWSTPDGVHTPTLTLDLAPGTRFDLVRVAEYLPLGVRVTRFAIEAEVAGQWQRLAEKDCIGAQRVVRLPAPIAPRRVRLVILDAPACPAIREFALFHSVAPVPVAAPVPRASDVLSTLGWRVVDASAPGAEALLDGDVATLWTQGVPTPGHPATLTLDLGRAVTLGGFSLTPPRHLAADATPPRGYRVATSADGQSWQDQGEGEFSNIAYALATQRIGFAAPVQARYLRLTFAEPALPGRAVLAIAGIGGFSAALPR
ncbi:MULTISPECIES: alpha-L-fucosidase [unclassified Novosphingobium]|uniref:alpha-L-fucosidase n=1 Tax=unclassified Novosphingobium TaxID=2644732 RepID=UPI00146D8F12|nr:MULTISPECIES: alpha-L-fucosidase [unclassified Novosphingobium]NMN03130.1 alpha-L-fucosidase [Novosphingobium sp. SG919]NMN86881.1 alpha-L-fucosidase [Novosphingobium sp. SG916]